MSALPIALQIPHRNRVSGPVPMAILLALNSVSIADMTRMTELSP